MRKAPSMSQLRHLSFKDRLALGADFGHFPIVIGLLLGKVFFFGKLGLPLIGLLLIGVNFLNIDFNCSMFIKLEKKFVNNHVP
jgi:hypothetical protein